MDTRRWQIVCEGWSSGRRSEWRGRPHSLRPVGARGADRPAPGARAVGAGRSFGVPAARGIPVEWPLSACCTGPGEVQLVARGAEGELLHATLRGRELSGFECIGSPAGLDGAPMGLASAPAACCREPGRMDVFAVGSAGALLHATRDDTGFSEFESLGGIEGGGGRSEPIPGAIAAGNCGSRGARRVRPRSRWDFLLKWWNGSRWSGSSPSGRPRRRIRPIRRSQRAVPLASAPIACGRGATRLDVFARGPRGDLLHKWWDGKTWSGFESLGMPVSAHSGARIPFTGGSMTCAWSRDQLDVFARGADGNVHLPPRSRSRGDAPGPRPRHRW